MREIGEHFPSGSPQSTHSLGRRFASSSASSRAREKKRIEKSKRSGGEGGIRTHVQYRQDQEVTGKIEGSCPLETPEIPGFRSRFGNSRI